MMKRKVLGIDCGTAIVGWSILEKDGSKFIHFANGAIKTPKTDDMPLRLKKIYEDLIMIIEKYSPTDMAIEDIFFFKNNKTVISVSQARGVIILAGINKGLEVFNYTPLQVKVAVTGYGRAEKDQVKHMVEKILHLGDKLPKLDDINDALAIGICHLNSVVLNSKTKI